MAEKKGFIAIDRNIQNWRWYTDSTTFRVWLHILMKCNFEEGNFKGTVILPGQWFTSYDHIAEALKISKSQARTAVGHLRDTQEIACDTAHYGLLITVLNWEKYNGIKKNSHAGTQADDRLIARKSHAGTQANRTNKTNKQCLSNKVTKKQEDKRVGDGEKNKTTTPPETAEFIPPTFDELRDYADSINYFEFDPERFIDYYSGEDWKVKKNGRYVPMPDWKRVVRSWMRSDDKKRIKEQDAEKHKGSKKNPLDGLPF